jgi:hypothetical protein
MKTYRKRAPHNDAGTSASMPLSLRNLFCSARQHQISLCIVQIVSRTVTENSLKCRDVDGNTVLHHACLGTANSLEIVEYLLQKFPEALTMENNDRFTPLDLAMRQDDIDLDLIAVLLGQWPSRELELNAGYMSCSLGPDVTRLLTCYAFKSLDMSKVHIREEGLLALLRGMETNTSIQSLTLNFFEYTNPNVCYALEDMLTRNRSLQSLTLHVRMQPVFVSRRFGRAILNGLKVNQTLMQLDLFIIPQYRLQLLMPMESRVSLHQVDRSEVDHYLLLNRAGRDKIRDTGLTKRNFVESIAIVSDNVSVLLDLLRMVPHVWTQ